MTKLTDERNKEALKAFRTLRLNVSPYMKECPMCSDLHHGFLIAWEARQEEIDKYNKRFRLSTSITNILETEIEELQTENKKLDQQRFDLNYNYNLQTLQIEKLKTEIDNIIPSHTLAKNNDQLLMENKKLREFAERVSFKECFVVGANQYGIGCKCDSCEARRLTK